MWTPGPDQAPVSPLPTVADTGEDTYSLAAEFPEVQGSYTLYRVVTVTVLPSDAEEEKIALAFLEETGMQSPDAQVVKT